MKFLVTGGKGFIGSHLVERLAEMGHEVTCLDRHTGDLKFHTEFPTADVVIHLAAFNSTHEFYTAAFDVIKDNILPTINVCNFYRFTEKKPLMVYTGTPESFTAATDKYDYPIPTDEKVPLVIDDVTNLRWSYAGSKALGEQVVIASGIPYLIVRPNNIYGPRQKNHFVDEFIERVHKRGDTTLYGWENTRSWLYIDDFIDAFIKMIFVSYNNMAKHGNSSIHDIVNIGSNDEMPVIKVAEEILRALKVKDKIIKKDAPEGSAKRRMPDITKLKKLTGWEPTTPLDVGINKTVKYWMKEFKIRDEALNELMKLGQEWDNEGGSK